MNYLTIQELSEFINLNINTVRIFLQHFTLAKHTKRVRMTDPNSDRAKTLTVLKINDASIYAFERYMKLKGYNYKNFNKEIKEFCEKKRK